MRRLMRKFVLSLVFCLCILIFLTQGVYAWSDDFQKGYLDENWILTGWVDNDDAITTYPSDTYNYAVFLRGNYYTDDGYDVAIRTNFTSSYFAFAHLGRNDVDYWDPSKYIKPVYLRLYNESGTKVYEKDVRYWRDYLPPNERRLFEVRIIAGYARIYIGGELMDSVDIGCNEVSLELFIDYAGTSCCRWWVDDFSTTGYVIDMGEYKYDYKAIPFDDEEIDVGWTASQYFDKGSEFYVKVKNVDTGVNVNITDINNTANTNGSGMIVFNRTELLDENYGLYSFYITRDGETMDYRYFLYQSVNEVNSSINFDKDKYSVNSTIKITYNIDGFESDASYYGRIINILGEKLKEWNIKTTSGTLTTTTTELGEEGDIFVLLIRDTYTLAYDYATIAEEVVVEGVTFNAKNEAVLGNVYVLLQQGASSYETNSNQTTGEYRIEELSSDIEISINASKINYTHNNFSFTPLQNGLYNINLFLLPDENHININPPAIVGLVQSYPFYQNVSEATVNLWNTSIGLATSNTTNSMGYFEFALDNTSMQTSDIVNETFNSSEYDTWVSLANSGIVPYTEKVTNTTDETPYERGTDYEMDYVAGKIKVLSTGNMSNNTDYHIDYEKYETTTYSINATKFKYGQMKQPQTFTVNGTEIKYIYLLMNPIYNLTVRARSTDTHATIMEFDTILNDGDVVQTTTGYTNFSVNYGIHKVEVSADGYYPSVSYVYVAEDTEKIMYLTPLEEAGGAGTYYPPPHLVEFKVQNVWGQPLSGVNVTAVPSETSMVNWSWIESVYGYGENITQTMSGITDSNGAVSFVMVETVKYKLYFTNESQNISAYREIYPKDDRYTITIGEIPEEKIGWWLSTAQNDSANTGNITIHYLDYNEPVKTQWVNFSIYCLDNDTLVYSHNFTTVNATNENTSIDLNASYTYKVKITAYHEDYGIISSTTIIVFVIPEKPKLPVAQELFKHLEPWQITLISMFVLICFGFIFGAVSAGTGGLIVAAMVAAFYYFGLLPSLSKEVASIVIPLILIVAVVNKLIEQRGVIRE